MHSLPRASGCVTCRHAQASKDFCGCVLRGDSVSSVEGEIGSPLDRPMHEHTERREQTGGAGGVCGWRATTSASSQRWRGAARGTRALLWVDPGSSGRAGMARSCPSCEWKRKDKISGIKPIKPHQSTEKVLPVRTVVLIPCSSQLTPVVSHPCGLLCC